MSTVLVAGSAHLDVLAQARNRDDRIDRSGDISIEVGGTGCNIAANLARAGVNARFLSAMNDSAYSKVILDYLAGMGVELHVETNPGLPTGAFSAHLNTDGRKVSVVSATPVERVDFEVERIQAAMNGAKAVVIDCNLSPMSIGRLVALANNRAIPVYVCAVSEEKSLKLGGISGSIKGIFINQAEFQFFSHSVLGGLLYPGEAAEALKAMILVSDGAAGSILAYPDGRSKRIPGAMGGEAGSLFGLEDALAAGFVLLHELRGFEPEEAANIQNYQQGAAGALEAAIDSFQHRAGHDAMTGVLNRQSAEQALSGAIDRRRKEGSGALSVLLLDIDHFKSINDTYGHSVGDEVIVSVTRAAQSCLRETDHLGRWGGEEFIIVLPGSRCEDALRVAERVRKAVEDGVKHPRQVTVSLGCCEMLGVSEDPRTLVEMADRALYEAKRTGRNRVVCAQQPARPDFYGSTPA